MIKVLVPIALLAWPVVSFAGGGGGPPGAGAGGGGPEPATWALLLASAGPGAWFVRRSLRQRLKQDESA